MSIMYNFTKKAFTLSEVLITLAVIGIVAALTLPSVMTNSKQKEFQTSFRKALNVLNNAISVNGSMEGDTPYDIKDISADLNGDGKIDSHDTAYFLNQLYDTEAVTQNGLAAFLMRHINVVKVALTSEEGSIGQSANFAFYTTDGMRFEVPYPYNNSDKGLPLHENSNIKIGNNSCGLASSGKCPNVSSSMVQKCGAYGLKANPNNTEVPPCLVVVDVNGDKKPNPVRYIKVGTKNNFVHSAYNVPSPSENVLSDVFAVMITDSAAYPYGVVAQKAFYDSKN